MPNGKKQKKLVAEWEEAEEASMLKNVKLEGEEDHEGEEHMGEEDHEGEEHMGEEDHEGETEEEHAGHKDEHGDEHGGHAFPLPFALFQVGFFIMMTVNVLTHDTPDKKPVPKNQVKSKGAAKKKKKANHMNDEIKVESMEGGSSEVEMSEIEMEGGID